MHLRMRHAVLLLLLLLQVAATTSCLYQNSEAPVTIGDNVIICVQLPSIGKRVPFNITVDTYTALKANGVYSELAAQGGDAGIALQFKSVSIPSGYLTTWAGEKKVAQLYSFVIRTDKGVVTAIESDNAAYVNAGCIDAISLTVDGDVNCFAPLDVAAGAANDPKILLSWIGTDSKGAYMLSQTRRLSRFSQFSLDNVYSSVLSIFR